MPPSRWNGCAMLALLAALSGCHRSAPVMDKGVRMTLRAPVADVPVGAPILLIVEIENTTDKEVQLPSCDPWSGAWDFDPFSDGPPISEFDLYVEPYPIHVSDPDFALPALLLPPPALPGMWTLPPRQSRRITFWPFGFRALATGTHKLWVQYLVDAFAANGPTWRLKSNVIRVHVQTEPGARGNRRTKTPMQCTEDRLIFLSELASVFHDENERSPRDLAELRSFLARRTRRNAAALGTRPASHDVAEAWLDGLLTDGWGCPLRAVGGFYSVGENGIDEYAEPDFEDDIVMIPGVPIRPPRPSMAAEPIDPRRLQNPSSRRNTTTPSPPPKARPTSRPPTLPGLLVPLNHVPDTVGHTNHTIHCLTPSVTACRERGARIH